MRSTFRWWLAVLVPVAIVAGVAVSGAFADSAASPHAQHRVVVHQSPTTTTVDPAAVAAQQLSVYVQALEAAHLNDFIQALELQDFLSSLPPPPPPPPVVTAPPAPSYQQSDGGDCSGSVVPDWIVQRESGGNPSAVNPSSGAYGCYQELPGHFADGGACAGLNMYSVADQKTCASRLSDGGANLSPWAE